MSILKHIIQILILVSFITLSSTPLYCQDFGAHNLVPNGSFENFNICPNSYSRTASDFKVNDWFSGNGGTPDFFHQCSNGESDVPKNWAGISDAFEGQGYVGIYCWKKNGDYREYIESAIQSALTKDTTYVISFRYKLSSYSRFTIDRIGLALVPNRVDAPGARLLAVKPAMEIILESPIVKETGTWQLAELRFKAKGDEAYVIIGNFSNDTDTRRYKLLSPQGLQEMLENSAYYYIDDVSITPVFLSRPPTPEHSEEAFDLNATYSFQTVQFEFDSHVLPPGSYAELSRLVDWLKDNPAVKVNIAGHTDDVGDEAYNRALSKKRAESVQDYLSSSGIDAGRITSTGYGKDAPLVSGTDETSRRANRRVEFILRSAEQ